MIKHFTSKAWIIKFEKPAGRYNRDYGIRGIYNKESQAQRAFAKLKDQKYYKIQEISLDSDTDITLFEFLY